VADYAHALGANPHSHRADGVVNPAPRGQVADLGARESSCTAAQAIP
jgi:hypothetical protein